MKKRKSFFKRFFKTNAIISGICAMLLFMSVVSFNDSLPDNIRVYKGDNLVFNNYLKIDTKKSANIKNTENSDESYVVTAKLFGAIPVKQVSVSEIESTKVAVSGMPFGIKIFTSGVMVVGMTDVESSAGKTNPAYSSGIRVGDVIKSLNGAEVTSNEDVADIINLSEGASVLAKVVRDGKNYTFTIKPVKSSVDGEYKAGIWVRDSSAGIGTMTFYSPVTGSFAGLGHAICDVDTSEILPLESGEIVGAKINAIEKGKNGDAGELCGTFTFEKLGDLFVNCENGLYGKLSKYDRSAKLYEVATKTEVKTGKAQIFTALDGDKPQKYDCVVERIDYSDRAEHSMIIKVTDKELINKTGGIVQGMSGSPIIQSGKLVGAVTHVFVNDSTKGYGIFAESMLETAQGVAESDESKEAS